MNDHRQVIFLTRIAVVAVLAMLIATACGGQELPSQVEVREKEWALEHEVTAVKAGVVTFVVKNEGALEHNFVIEGADQQIELVLPQGTETLEVTLAPGTHKISCDLPGHQEAGMVSEITVR